MAKKCIVCEKDAVFCVKDCTDYYCEECAEEYFGDVSYLQKVEEQAQILKKLIDKKTQE